METCSIAGIMSLCNLAIRPRNLWCLIVRILPKLLGLAPSLLKKFREDGHDHPPSVGTALGTLPELSQDILMAIFATLEIPDLVRAGSVCSSWHTAYTILRDLGKYRLSQTPCLLYTSESSDDGIAFLYSLIEKRAYKLALPEPPIRSRFLIGSSHGWLVTVDDRSEMHLINPITGEQIALPSVITIEHVKPIFNKSGAVEKYEYSRHTATRVYHTPSIYALGELRDYLQFKAFVFLETSKGSYIVVLIHGPYCQISFTRVGDAKWTWLPPHTDYEDCSYKDGILYAVTKVGEIYAFDINGPVVTMNLIMEMAQDAMCENMYIVQAPWGDLLNVWRDTNEDRDSDSATLVRNTEEIKIYKVDTMAKKAHGNQWST
uniref:Uncharacterized protein n=1 Tax=Arundo donax TaxID=35708 RepID=A0A0A9CE25_ARUDO